MMEMAPRPVILDTNFLLVPFRFRLDILGELDYLVDYSHSFVVSSKSMEELKKIARQVGRDGMAARLALKMVDANRERIAVVRQGAGKVDDWIVSYAEENRAIVCTNDSELRRRLKAKGIKVATLKSKTKVGFI